MALSGGWWGRAVARARGASGLLKGEAWPWRARAARFSSGRGPGPPAVTELDKADAWLLRKAHETGFLSWFRNGLLATGVGVISYVQSDMGREAAYEAHEYRAGSCEWQRFLWHKQLTSDARELTAEGEEDASNQGKCCYSWHGSTASTPKFGKPPSKAQCCMERNWLWSLIKTRRGQNQGASGIQWPGRGRLIEQSELYLCRPSGSDSKCSHTGAVVLHSWKGSLCFFILGGICVSYGSASYLVSLVLLRRTMMLSFSTALLNCAAVTTVALFWLCAVSLYIGRLEVEIIQDDSNDKCPDKKKDDGKSDK